MNRIEEFILSEMYLFICFKYQKTPFSLCIWGMAQVELDVAPRPLRSKPLE